MFYKQYNRNLNLYSTLIILALKWNSNKNREKSNKKLNVLKSISMPIIKYVCFFCLMPKPHNNINSKTGVWWWSLSKRKTRHKVNTQFIDSFTYSFWIYFLLFLTHFQFIYYPFLHCTLNIILLLPYTHNFISLLGIICWFKEVD